jgi:hypothetical protein
MANLIFLSGFQKKAALYSCAAFKLLRAFKRGARGRPRASMPPIPKSVLSSKRYGIFRNY